MSPFRAGGRGVLAICLQGYYGVGMSKGDIVTFKRYAPGLYVDSTQQWVISRDCEATGNYSAFYTIRKLLGFGPMLDGVTIMPDYDAVHHGEAYSLADAKRKVVAMVAEGGW